MHFHKKDIRKALRGITLAIGFFGLSFGSALAATETWEFDLTFDTITGGNLAGQTFTGSFSFDGSIFETNPSAFLSGNNSRDGADLDLEPDGLISNFEIVIGSSTFDYGDATSSDYPWLFGNESGPSFLVYAGVDAGVFLSINENFLDQALLQNGDCTANPGCYGRLTDYRLASVQTPTAVPLPGAFLLLSSALGLLAIRRRN